VGPVIIRTETNRQKMRWLLGVVIACLALVVVYYGSAIYSLAGLVAATRAGDGAAIVAQTDLPRLSRSLSEQIVAAYLDRIGAKRRVGGTEKLLVSAYGASVADALVTQMLTPENLTELLKSGRLAETRLSASANALPPLGELQRVNVLNQFGRMHFVTPVQLSVRVSNKTEPDDYAALVLHREWLTWKLAGIDLPRTALRNLAASLPVK